MHSIDRLERLFEHLELGTAQKRIVSQHSLLVLAIRLRILRVIQHLREMPDTRILDQRNILPSSYVARLLFFGPRRPILNPKPSEQGRPAILDANALLECRNILEVPLALSREVRKQVVHRHRTSVVATESPHKVSEFAGRGRTLTAELGLIRSDWLHSNQAVVLLALQTRSSA